MGVVYRARHLALDRVVALKMIRAGAHADAEELRRFRREAEAVARLQHPGIVQIFEIGQHEGVPFLALEYCAGGSLHRKLAGTPLPPGEAARLTEALAQALAAAHEKHIIHRDLKPHNVLLTDSGVPKLTDFGLARRLDGVSTDTRTGAVMGTPSYMPPEQARGELVGPAADVYALGAVLYELLTGRPPFLGHDAYAVLAGVLHEEVVPVRRLQPAVPRDLETICLKCLRKEPDARYATAPELAADLRRFQQGEPIRARPVGRLERLAKWARRRPAVAALSGALLTATLLLIAGLVTGIVVTTKALGQERLAKELAEKRLNQTKKAREILASIFTDLSPRLEAKGGPPIRAQLGERLEKAVEVLEEEAVGDRLEVAELQQTLGDAQLHLGYADQAIKLLTKARQTREEELGVDHPDTLKSMNNLASAYQAAGQLDKAVPLLEQALQKRKATLGADHVDTLRSMNDLASAYRAARRLDQAVPLFEQTLERAKATLGPDDPHTLTCMNNLAGAYQAAGQPAKAVPLLEQTLEKMQATLGPGHPDTLTGMNNLAAAYWATNEPARAVPLFEQTLEKRLTTIGADHPDTLTSMNNLAAAYQATGRLDKALPLYEQTLEKTKAKLGPDHPDTLGSMHNLAEAYEQTKAFAQAEPLRRELLRAYRAQGGLNQAIIASALVGLGAVLVQQNKYAEAESPLREGVELRVKLQPSAWSTFNAKRLLGTALLGQKGYANAEPLLLEGYEGMKQREAQIPLVAKVRLVEAAQELVDLYEAWDHLEQAARWRKTVETERARLPAGHP
jgi:tetratricopeptide (TPR) repeat protein